MTTQENRRSEQGLQSCSPADPVTGRVLLVDDNASIRTMAALYLRALRYRVVEAVDGEDAIRKVREAPCDLILMDLNLPGVDGPEATRRIRALGSWLTRIPIIGMTAADHNVRRQFCLDAGMNDVIDKVSLLPALPDLLRCFVRPASVDASPPLPEAIEASRDNPELGVSELNCRLGLIGRDTMARTFEGFYSQGQRLLKELDVAWLEGRHSEAAAVTHQLCGGAATFQMISLHTTLADLETALRAPTICDEDVAAQLAQLSDTWTKSIAGFKAWLESHPLQSAA